jgi:hypothetical protein
MAATLTLEEIEEFQSGRGPVMGEIRRRICAAARAWVELQDAIKKSVEVVNVHPAGSTNAVDEPWRTRENTTGGLVGMKAQFQTTSPAGEAERVLKGYSPNVGVLAFAGVLPASHAGETEREYRRKFPDADDEAVADALAHPNAPDAPGHSVEFMDAVMHLDRVTAAGKAELDAVKDMKTWPEEIRALHGLAPASHARTEGELIAELQKRASNWPDSKGSLEGRTADALAASQAEIDALAQCVSARNETIARLRAEVNRLRKENKRIRYYRNKSGRDQHEGIEALRARVAELEGALEHLIKCCDWTPSPGGAIEQARAALAKDKG